MSAETSLIVRQFVQIAAKKIPVHKPKNEFRTVAVLEEQEKLCPKCKWQGTWDVWHGSQDGIVFILGKCRCCGHEMSL